MKQIIILLVLAFSCSSFAWISTSPKEQVYTFKFKMEKETFELTRKAPSYEDAFDQAAQECFNHFKGHGKLTEDRGLDIIDVCANPRS